jgi:hypothetical protein
MGFVSELAADTPLWRYLRAAFLPPPPVMANWQKRSI